MIESAENPYHPGVVITGLQIKLGRLALGWTAQTLADRAHLGVATISRAEQSDVPPITVSNLFAIQRALEDGGVIFIEDGAASPAGGGPGVRLAKNDSQSR
jgi:transcriptional regulator with XRE-family HTH domain